MRYRETDKGYTILYGTHYRRGDIVGVRGFLLRILGLQNTTEEGEVADTCYALIDRAFVRKPLSGEIVLYDVYLVRPDKKKVCFVQGTDSSQFFKIKSTAIESIIITGMVNDYVEACERDESS